MAITVSQLIFIAVVFVLVSEENNSIDISLQNSILIAIPVIVLLFIITGRIIYQQQLKKLRSKNVVNEKLNGYKTLQIIQLALIEFCASGFFIAAFLCQNTVFVYGSIALVLYMISLRPSKNKLETELQLDYRELDTLSNPDFIVYERTYSIDD